ncbi:MAG: hypothetical protein KF832_05090 [Caldilineaceae bacterium]|nr:hypothetical protein [Caldilineaceae bacterium]
MRPLTASELLDLWEQGQQLPVWQKALLLVTAASPEASMEQVAQWPIGHRDALLIQLRAWTFGPQLASVVNCPHCAEPLEFTIESSHLLGEPTSATMPAHSLTTDEYTVTFRLPNTSDLAAVAMVEDQETAQQQILHRCLLAVQRQSDTAGSSPPIPPAQVPPKVFTALLSAMTAADPLADLQFELTCPACGQPWRAAFDIGIFFWRELDDWVQRTLADVHRLALAYGWREREILALTPWRRRTYLALISA